MIDDRVDSWDPFDLRPRRTLLQAAYCGLTAGVFYGSCLLLGLTVLILR